MSGAHQHGGEPDGLREDGGAPLDDTVQGLVPPVVGGHPQALDGGSGALHLAHLLLEGHAGHEIRRSALRGQIRIEVGRRARRLSERRRAGQQEQCDHERIGFHVEASGLGRVSASATSRPA